MADQRKQPDLFRVDLFSSPTPAGGLSFGLGGDSFSSPFSLAPALATAAQSTPARNDEVPERPTGSGSPSNQTAVARKPVTGTPTKTQQQQQPDVRATKTPQQQQPDVRATKTPQQQQPDVRATKTPQQQQPDVRATKTPQQPDVIATPISSVAELSNVPLDTPPPSSKSPPVSSAISSSSSSSSSTPHRPPPTIPPSVGPGWNDPPQQPSASTTSMPEPGVGMAVAESYPIQPLAGQPDTPQATPTAPPPAGSATQQQKAANPYRKGLPGARKAGYVPAGMPAYTAPGGPPLQPLQQAPPTSLPHTVPTPATGPLQPLQSYTTPVEMTALPAYQEGDVVPGAVGGVAQPVRHHWFYLRPSERYWTPFSLTDSALLEHSWTATGGDTSQQAGLQAVPTDGGRYDVDLQARSRAAIYWEEPASQVRRCSWFYKGESDRWYMPYPEDVAARLEEHYMSAVGSGVWGGQVAVGEAEAVVMHSQSSMAHYPASQFQPIAHDRDYSHPRSVLRGFAEIDHVEQGEQSRIDHLVFVVHGIGEHHELSFRCLVDCVDDFREVSQLMLRTHRFTGQAPQEGDTGGRVEFLPIHWHTALHGDNMGVDAHLQKLSLKSISRLRGFTNSTLLDILFFTSPTYCQAIIDQVAEEMNRMYQLFLQRQPGYSGGVSLMGHSLGSCILFDLLAHQTGPPESGLLPAEPSTQGDRSSQPSGEPVGETAAEEEEEEEEGEGEEEEDTGAPTTLEATLSHLGLAELTEVFLKEQIDFDSLLMIGNEDLRELGIPMGPRKKLASFISTQGEKIRAARERRARVEAEHRAREKERQKQLKETAQQQTRLQGVKFVKGVAGTGQPHINYPQLHFKTESLFTLGSPIGLFLTVRGVEELGPEFKLPHCQQIFNIFHPFDPVAYRLEPLVCETPPEKPVLMPHHKGRKRFHLELYETVEHVGASMKHYVVDGMRNVWQQLNELARSHRPPEQASREELDTPTIPEAPLAEQREQEVGRLNGGRRVDYVLQEKPIEKLNEYLFALSSHLSYWHSEDTALFILKEVYEEMNPELIKS